MRYTFIIPQWNLQKQNVEIEVHCKWISTAYSQTWFKVSIISGLDCRKYTMKCRSISILSISSQHLMMGKMKVLQVLKEESIFMFVYIIVSLNIKLSEETKKIQQWKARKIISKQTVTDEDVSKIIIVKDVLDWR